MKTPFTTPAALILTGALVIISPSAYAQAGTPSMGALTRSAFANPNTRPPSGSTTFTPAGGGNLFLAQMLANPALKDADKAKLQTYTMQVNAMVEKAYTDYGYPQNDVGVALGGFLETCWEVSNDTFKTGGGDNAEEKRKTQAAVRQIQNALLSAPAYKNLPNKNKQLVYETCTFMTGHLATQWQQAGSDAAKKAAVQETARKQLQTLFGVGATSLTRNPDGTFAAIGGASSGGTIANRPRGKATPRRGTTHPPTAAATSGPLPAASSHGAQIYVKYAQRYGTSFSISNDHLILFPDGSAFNDLPSKPVSSFDPATLRSALKPFYSGTWKKSGATLVLNFPNASRDKITTLRKVPRGWYDGTGTPKTDSSYDTYFPVAPLSPAQLTGTWKTESLTTMGFAGGTAPIVAHGSSGTRVFNPNGTFSGDGKSFTSSTASSGGTTTGFYGTGGKKGAGRWRLDGPLMTIEENGTRTVAPAFILPFWNKTGPPEILINGDRWERPEKK